MKVKLKRGRSNSSWLVIAMRNLHVFVWTPGMGNDAAGFTARWRGDGYWRHVRVSVMQRNPVKPGRFRLQPGESIRVRPTLTVLEIAGWRTANGTKERATIKSYVRLKAAAPGGTRVSHDVC